MTENNKTIIYTDGSSLGNPGPGGWGAIVLLVDGNVTELGGAEKDTTNNRMEMTAIIEALSFVKEKDSKIILHTDSSYTINGITKWIHGWQKNGWTKKDKGEVLNKDLWQKLLVVVEGLDIEWKHVSGHVGTPGNERADTIATSFAETKSLNLYTGAYESYGIDLFVEEDEEKKAARSAGKARSKAKAYSYLSLVDGEFKKHKTWAECEACVKGTAGARFRKALSAEDEKEIMKEWGV
ncbi:ribonuclease HI [Patescibacteria group bacterium]